MIDKQNIIDQANMICNACKNGWHTGTAPTWGLQQKIFRNLLNFSDPSTMRSILDVGCGEGGLLEYIIDNSLDYEYTGIDISDKMIEKAKETAKRKFSNDNFIHQDVMEHEGSYDYVIAAGIFNEWVSFTQDEYIRMHLEKLFSLCKRSISTFFLSKLFFDKKIDGLYYHDPAELIKQCMSISKSFIVNHKSVPGIIILQLYR